MKTYVHLWQYLSLSVFFLGWALFQTEWENQNTHFILTTFSRKSCCLWDNVEEYGRTRQATGDNMIQHRKDARIQRHTLILIAFTRQQLLRKSASLLRYRRSACLVVWVQHTCNSTNENKALLSYRTSHSYMIPSSSAVPDLWTYGQLMVLSIFFKTVTRCKIFASTFGISVS